MKIIMKFKDGLKVDTDIHSSTGDYNFFDILLKGVENNSEIEIEGLNGEKLGRTYLDLDSIEIKIHE